MENRELDDNVSLTIDPGVTTGFVLSEFQDSRTLVAPFQLKANCFKVWTLLNKIAPRRIICEDFEIRTTTETGTILFSVQLIGVVNAYVESFGRYDPPILYMQKAAHMKKGHFGWHDKVDIGREKLKEALVYKPGEDWHHSMDAMRHFMQWYNFGAGYEFKTTRKELLMVDHDWLMENYNL